MFGIGLPELVVIFVVALIFIGPKRLPDLARTLAKALSEFRSVAEEVRESLDVREELAPEKEELLKDYDSIVKDIRPRKESEGTEGEEESLETKTVNGKAAKKKNAGVTGGEELGG